MNRTTLQNQKSDRESLNTCSKCTLRTKTKLAFEGVGHYVKTPEMVVATDMNYFRKNRTQKQ